MKEIIENILKEINKTFTDENIQEVSTGCLNKSSRNDEQENDLCGKIEEITFLGDTTRLIIKLSGENFFSCEQNLIVDLPTIICDDLKKGNSIFLKILKKWKL